MELKVGGISGEKEQLTPGGFDQQERGRGLVKAGVVQHDHVLRTFLTS
jgi:hypothetical protein